MFWPVGGFGAGAGAGAAIDFSREAISSLVSLSRDLVRPSWEFLSFIYLSRGVALPLRRP